MGICLTNHITLNLHIHHNEISAIQRIGHNTTHKSSRQHHCIRTLFIKEGLDLVLVSEVELLMTAAHKVGVASLQEVIPYSRAHKAVVARHVDF